LGGSRAFTFACQDYPAMASCSFTYFPCCGSSPSPACSALVSTGSSHCLSGKYLLLKNKLSSTGLSATYSSSIFLGVPGDTRRRRCLAIQNGKVPLFLAALESDDPSTAGKGQLGSTNGAVSDGKKERLGPGSCPCLLCGRRRLLTPLGGLLVATSNTRKASSASLSETRDYNVKF
jgi:hypothetical protein